MHHPFVICTVLGTTQLYRSPLIAHPDSTERDDKTAKSTADDPADSEPPIRPFALRKKANTVDYSIVGGKWGTPGIILPHRPLHARCDVRCSHVASSAASHLAERSIIPPSESERRERGATRAKEGESEGLSFRREREPSRTWCERAPGIHAGRQDRR